MPKIPLTNNNKFAVPYLLWHIISCDVYLWPDNLARRPVSCKHFDSFYTPSDWTLHDCMMACHVPSENGKNLHVSEVFRLPENLAGRPASCKPLDLFFTPSDWTRHDCLPAASIRKW